MTRNASIIINLLFMASLMGCKGTPQTITLVDAARLGPTSAVYEIVVFSDFQCPFCRHAASAFKKLQNEHPEHVTLYFKHFPLSQHSQATQAAMAAESARRQQKFWEMHDLLFEYGRSLNDATYEELAKMLSLNVAQFLADMNSDEVAQIIDRDRAEGEAAGLDGTPFLLLNGVVYNGSYSRLIDKIKSKLGVL